MSAVIDQPTRTIVDPTAGLELVTGDVIALEATRHLFLAANLLDPARQRDINLPDGGEELVNRCLRRTNGLLPKCEITPLEMWVEWMPSDLFPEGQEHLALHLKEQPGIDSPGANFRIFKELLGYPYYPGHTVVDALGMATGEKRGVVEIENLRGVPYGKEDRQMQDLFFPLTYRKPVELRLIRQRIEEVAGSVADPDVKDTAGYMILSADQCSEYLSSVVSKAQTQLLERKSHNYVHSLSPKIRSFMAQLEIAPNALVQAHETVNQAVTANLPPEVIELLASQSEALKAIGPAIAAAVSAAIKEATATNKPPAKVTPKSE